MYTTHIRSYKDPGGEEEEQTAVGVIAGGATLDGGFSDWISA